MIGFKVCATPESAASFASSLEWHKLVTIAWAGTGTLWFVWYRD